MVATASFSGDISSEPRCETGPLLSFDRYASNTDSSARPKLLLSTVSRDHVASSFTPICKAQSGEKQSGKSFSDTERSRLNHEDLMSPVIWKVNLLSSSAMES